MLLAGDSCSMPDFSPSSFGVPCHFTFKGASSFIEGDTCFLSRQRVYLLKRACAFSREESRIYGKCNPAFLPLVKLSHRDQVGGFFFPSLLFTVPSKETK